MSHTDPNYNSSYFETRLAALGITAELNKVNLLQSDPNGTGNILLPVPIFRQHERGIEIIVYSIDRTTIRIEKEGSRIKRDWSIIRLEKPIDNKGRLMKYIMPKGQGSYPFFPPHCWINWIKPRILNACS